MSKVTIIGPAHPLRGGLATFNERLARQFQEEGQEVQIYTFSLQYPKFLFPGKTQLSESPAPKDLKITQIINSINPINWITTGYRIKKENPDLVIIRYWLPFMGPCLGTIIRIIKSNKKSVVIGLIDNALPHEKRLGDKLFTQYLTKGLDGFITMSELVKRDLTQFTKSAIHLVQHPLYDNFGPKVTKEVARKSLDLPQDAFIFLFFGFIRKYKGLDLLIEAFELMKPRPDIQLVIAGEYYAEEDETISKINRCSYRQQIHQHTHFIKNEDVAKYFSACDCVIQPYRNATQSGVTPLSYHFEVPMIVTNVGALPDLVPPDLGIVCEPEPSSIAKAMEKMLTFDTAHFVIKIKIAKQKLSWEHLTATFFEVMSTCKKDE